MIKTVLVLWLICTSFVLGASRDLKQAPRAVTQKQEQRDLGHLLGGLLGGVTGLLGQVVGIVDGLLNGILNVVVRDLGCGILGIVPNLLNVVVNDVSHLLHDVVTDVEILLDDVVGLVFAITDDLLGNRLVVFPRFSNGSISGNGNFFATGGLGSGLIEVGSQHSIVVSTNGDRVYCVNSGSNSVSVFAINPLDFSLKLVALLDSGGEFPISLALSLDNSVLFVLNAGGQGRLAAIDLSATLALSVHLPGLLDLNVGLALNLGLFSTAAVSVINLNQFGTSPSSGAGGPTVCTNITGVSDIVISPDGSWIIVANKATGSLITIALQGGIFLPIQLGLSVSLSLLNLNLLDVDLAVGIDLNLGISLGLGVAIAPLSLSFAGTATLLVGVGGALNGLLTFNFDCNTGQLVLMGNQTTGGGSGSGSNTGSSSGGSGSGGLNSSGGGTFVTNVGNHVIVNPGFLGLGGLLAGVLNLVDGLLVVVDHVVDNLLNDVVVLVDHLLYNVVATVDGLIYTLGLGGIICGFQHNPNDNSFTPCGCTNPTGGLLKGLALL